MATPRSAGEAALPEVALADELAALDEAEAVPPLNRVGMVLAGDLYSAHAAT
jgi:hypothetical protein